MSTVWWTERAQDDLAAVHAFPHSGRAVPEFNDPSVREVLRKPYRIVYRLVSDQEVHVLTVHHAAREFPDTL